MINAIFHWSFMVESEHEYEKSKVYFA